MVTKELMKAFRNLAGELDYEIGERIDKAGGRSEYWESTKAGEKYLADTDAMQEFSEKLAAFMESLGIKPLKKR